MSYSSYSLNERDMGHFNAKPTLILVVQVQPDQSIIAVSIVWTSNTSFFKLGAVILTVCIC